MNTLLRRFLALAIGCSLVVGGAAFADTENTDSSTKTIKAIPLAKAITIGQMDDLSEEALEDAVSVGLIKIEGDWEDGDWEEGWDENDIVWETISPMTGEEFVKDLTEIYTLTKAEKGTLIKLYDEAIELEKVENPDWDKFDKLWGDIDDILLKYEKAEIIKEDLPAFDVFVEGLFIDASKLDATEKKAIQSYYNDLEKYKAEKDGDKFYEAYENLFNWMDENLDEDQWADEGDMIELEMADLVTDEELTSLILEEVKDIDVDDMLKDFPVKFTDEDKAAIKAIYKDMAKAAEDKAMDKLEGLFEKLDEVYEKYEDEFDKLYDDIYIEEDLTEDGE